MAYGKPLDGVRVLALEQMQALPFATQLLARLGAEVVKVEHPVDGESGRGAMPAMTDRAGKQAGATFVRNNLDKRSVGIDLKQPAGRELVLRLAPHFDVFAENFKAGALRKMGLGYDDVAAPHLDRKSTRLNSSHMSISYAVFCLKKKKRRKEQTTA